MYIYPCKDCAERTCDCHGKCERYLTAQREHKRLKDKVLKAKAEEDSFIDYKANIIHETRKKHEGRR